jgi:hypothetical protein
MFGTRHAIENSKSMLLHCTRSGDRYSDKIFGAPKATLSRTKSAAANTAVLSCRFTYCPKNHAQYKKMRCDVEKRSRLRRKLDGSLLYP